MSKINDDLKALNSDLNKCEKDMEDRCCNMELPYGSLAVGDDFRNITQGLNGLRIDGSKSSLREEKRIQRINLKLESSNRLLNK